MAAALEVVSPSGHRTRVALQPLPFHIGRTGANELPLRDTRISRRHARIVEEGGAYFIEDLESRYGVFVNGARVERQQLAPADRIEFGFADSYQLVFSVEEGALETGAGGLARLRATLELARAMQAALSTDDVLDMLVRAALEVTGCERGFLLLRQGDDLTVRVARGRAGPLPPGELRVPTRLLLRALEERREFLSMSFDPSGGGERSVADLELRSVLALPVVRIRAGGPEETGVLSAAEETAGLLYLDSRGLPGELPGGSRETLATLALEASIVLENARLLEELWARQRAEEELRIARRLQESLLPRALPEGGWLRAAGSNRSSLQVAGDFFDVRPVGPSGWVSVVADVSGKGMGAALLAALLEGMFLAAPYSLLSLEEMMPRVNRFLLDRTQGEQYATVFYCALDDAGLLRWVNAGHPPALRVRPSGELEDLPAGGPPLGLLEEAVWAIEHTQLEPGDKLVIYTDGLAEACNAEGDFFFRKRLRPLLRTRAGDSCRDLHDALVAAVREFTADAPPRDDITVLVLELAADRE
ncbi:MAG: FHA domain-containing protein [Acidobacteria bacterium]|nr:FHA domain-containing protein [Acidobacteriota bacterium]